MQVTGVGVGGVGKFMMMKINSTEDSGYELLSLILVMSIIIRVM